ncbi:ATP-binding protein [Nocardioides sp. MAHUQ-72]|uniref:ATP-binding protein n=1 Tax=unclassified Nocardioides TaxID=2615069 RepID=UPI00360606B7
MPGSVTRPGTRPTLTTALGFVLVYVVLGFVGRATTVDGETFALVWPAGGLAVLWFLVRGAGLRSIDSVLLAAAVVGVNSTTGAPLSASVVLVVTNLLQTLLAVGLLLRWCPEMWGCGGERALDSPRALSRYLAAAAAATAAGALVGTLAFGAVRGEVDWVGGALWFGRNLCSVLTVTTLGLLAGQWRSTTGPRAPLVRPGRTARAELAGAILLTVAMYVLAFVFDDLPLAFPLLAVTAWVALRFATLVSAAHATLIGVATVALTLHDVGPFALVVNPELGALLAQFYVTTIVVTALAVSTGRDEREALATELRRSQAEAVYESSLRDAIIGSMAEGVVVIDETGEVLVANRAAGEILGRPTTGWSLFGVGASHPDGSPLQDHERPSWQALRGGSVRDMEVMLPLPDGSPRALAVSAVPLPRDDHSGRARALMLARDTTVEHARRQELASFAGVVAHDLRNPLAAIDGWTELIAEELDAGELDPDVAREFVSRVRSSSRRMRELIRDLLAHATSGSREMSEARVDVAGLVDEVTAARHADGLVRCGRIPLVAGDPVLLRQVVDNLIGNALKYVAPGEQPRIDVSGRTAGDQVVVRVADRGIGLPEGEHDRVFEEFHRAHHRDYEGSGLGLSICRRIVTRHGGTIVARDNPAGRGTVIELTLPAYVRPSVPDPAGPAEAAPPEASGPVVGADAGPVAQVG